MIIFKKVGKAGILVIGSQKGTINPDKNGKSNIISEFNQICGTLQFYLVFPSNLKLQITEPAINSPPHLSILHV